MVVVYADDGAGPFVGDVEDLPEYDGDGHGTADDIEVIGQHLVVVAGLFGSGYHFGRHFITTTSQPGG